MAPHPRSPSRPFAVPDPAAPPPRTSPSTVPGEPPAAGSSAPPAGAPVRTFEIIAAGASATNRADTEANQDRWAQTPLAGDAGRSIVVGDGVGSQPDSGPVAAAAVDAAVLRLAADDPETATRHATSAVQAALASGPMLDGNSTLLVLAAHVAGPIDIAYVGNGAILEIAAVDLGEGHTKLRWINHTLPQIDKHHALTSFVGPRAPEATPYLASFVVPAGQARAFLLCTDGIYTAEESPPGFTADGSVWHSVPEQLVAVMRSLEDIWPDLLDLPAATAEKHLGCALATALADLQRSGRLEDDATVAAVFLRPAPAPGRTPP